ncbi:alpha/beta hydrolase [Pandoraea apista]|uniref:Alpha/beta hydrolase n=1 Tax=Pandoraea apista TaxID=93218 RepID=A0A5E5PAB9_9BURK|nr:alpha/beta hydrolase [Pandoraea apista]OXS88527.1 esterase [Pandoraea apista]VVG73638.1 alpha/beta hydrolase [Pandoraea apista]
MTNRRQFVGYGLAALAAASSSRSAWADDVEKKVFLDYTQKQLNEAYTQTVWAPNAKQVIDGYAKTSEEVRRKLPPVTYAYGDKPSERLDVFAPAGARGLPVMVFIHGGAWQQLSKEDSAGPAPVFVAAGAVYIAINFDNMPDNTLPGMVDQCRRALVWVGANATRFGGDPERIYVSGHSSGGHLTAVMLSTDWRACAAPAQLLKGGVVMSGMCDLAPVVLSVRGTYLKLSPEQVTEYSPIRHLNRFNCPVLVAWGTLESPEFKRQNRQLADALAGRARLAGVLRIKGANHFEVVNELNRADTSLTRATLALMGLTD